MCMELDSRGDGVESLREAAVAVTLCTYSSKRYLCIRVDPVLPHALVSRSRACGMDLNNTDSVGYTRLLAVAPRFAVCTETHEPRSRDSTCGPLWTATATF